MAQPKGMSVTVDRKTLGQALTDLGKVKPWAKLPILGTVRIDSGGTRGVELTVTNLETTPTVQVPGTVDTPGVVCMNHKALSKIVRTVKTDDITLTDGGVEVSGAFLPVECFPPDEFPQAGPVTLATEDNQRAVFHGADLIPALEALLDVVSRDETRPSLNGIYIEASDVGTIFTATDGHRLLTLDLPTVQTGDFTAIIRPDMASVIVARLKRTKKRALAGENMAALSLDENGAGVPVWFVMLGDVMAADTFASFDTITARPVEGPFPNYRQVIPADGDRTRYTLDASGALEAFQTFVPVADPLTHQVRCSFGRRQFRVSIASDGSGGITVPCTGPSGEHHKAGYNASYAVDMFKRLTGSVTLGFTNTTSALVIESENMIGLLMPLRLTD